MENSKIVRGTFKAKSRKQLEYVLEALRKSFGRDNINSLSPTFFYKAKIYILDVEIRIADALLRFNFKEAKPDASDKLEER